MTQIRTDFEQIYTDSFADQRIVFAFNLVAKFRETLNKSHARCIAQTYSVFP